MVYYYRLKELGFTLASGSYIVPAREFEPVDAATAIVEQARRIAEETAAKAQAAYEEERRKGYEDGMAQAREDGARQILADSLTLDRKLMDIERQLAQLVVDCVHTLLGTLDESRQAEALLRRALRQMRKEKRAELRVAPGQLALARAAIESVMPDFPDIELIDAVEDTALTGSQTVVETAIGRVECDLARDFESLSAVLLGGAHRAVTPPDGSAISDGVAGDVAEPDA